MRTLKSHREIENRFNKLWQSRVLNVLDKNDDRFKREFAKPDDDEVYNSTLLRIALIQGRKLSEWQIYKALHSAFQRRGYDKGTDEKK